MTETSASPIAGVTITASRQFGTWMAEQGVSLAFTTYQAGKLFFIGLNPEGELSVFERTFNRCMGLHAVGRSLFLSTLYQLWRFEDILEPGQQHEGYDRLYVPRVGYTTGDLDIHDLAVDADGRILFVNALFSCLATIDLRHSFVPLWRPPFISRLAPEDRCHLNGMAMVEERPRYVTSVSRADVNEGWRDRRRDSGLIMDVRQNQTILDGLSMPHSPRVHGGRLWFLESGTGHLCRVVPDGKGYEKIAFCPGYLRGLDFHGRFAAIGLSKCRQNRTFSDLPLDDILGARGAVARCGIQIIDTDSGDALHSLRIEGVVEELYDVIFLPECRRPMALGFKSDEIRRVINIGPRADLFRGNAPAPGEALLV
ncbi:MAG: TIGR03032 family protein [Magnetococcales bacterium]|nr:TIGR03032 family protein [Magnetococcales bacterium]